MPNKLHNVTIFYSGTHTSGEGITRPWTKDDLERAVKHFNETRALYAPAATVEHPPKDGRPWPRFGDLSFAKVIADPIADDPNRYAIVADFEPVTDDFYEWVKNNNFPNRSTGFRADGTIHHIAFLGANPPALKGMSSIVFNAAVEPLMSYSDPVIDPPATDTFGDGRKGIIASFLRDFRELLRGENLNDDATPEAIADNTATIENKESNTDNSLAGAKEMLTPAGTASAGATENKEENKGGTPGLLGNEGTVNHAEIIAAKDKEIADLKARIEKEKETADAANVQFAERLRAIETTSRKNEFDAWVKSAEVAKRVLPADIPSVISDLMEYAEESGEVTYTEGTEEKKGSKVDREKARILRRPVIETRGEIATEGTNHTENNGTSIPFEGTSAASDEVAKKVIAIQAEFKAKGKAINYEQAHGVFISRKEVSR